MKRTRNNNIKRTSGHSLLLTALAGLLLWTACTKDDEVVLRVVTENYRGGDKAYIEDDLVTYWSNGDLVRINEQNLPIQIQTVNQQATCYIHGIDAAENYWTVYPASIADDDTYYDNTGTGTLNGLTLPASYTYTGGNETDGQYHQWVPTIMAAYLNSRTGTINYHNACVALKITLTNTYSRDLYLSKATISDNDAPLCGPFSITDFATDHPTLTYAGGSTVNEAHKQVELSFGPDRLTLAQNATAIFYIILPPTSNYPNNKFTVTVTTMDGNTDGETVYEFNQTQSDNAIGNIGRNILAPIDIYLDNPHTMVLKGKGTQENPYKITSIDDLQSMHSLVAHGYRPIGGVDPGAPFASAYYALQNDITASSAVTVNPIGTISSNFTGHFDGNGHTLSGLSFVGGLFGYVGPGATISNLKINGANIDLTDATAGGAICAHADRATINHCQVTGEIYFNNINQDAAVYVGSIVGSAVGLTESHSTVLNCHNGAHTVVFYSNLRHRVGGIAGQLLNSAIYNCYTLFSTSPRSSATYPVIYSNGAYSGGIVGRMEGDSYVVNSYFSRYDYIDGANITGHTGDICGELNPAAHIVNCYYPNNLYAKGNSDPDNLLGNYSIQSGYTINGTALTTRLNQYVNQMSGLGLLSWTASSSSAPTLSF